MSEDGFGHLVEGDPTTDIGCDPALEHKILTKIEALKERLVLWTRRLDESVYLNNSQGEFHSALYNLVSYHVSQWEKRMFFLLFPGLKPGMSRNQSKPQT